MQWDAILPNSKGMALISWKYRSTCMRLPVGCTSMRRRMMPDFASVIRTGLLVPMNRNDFGVMEYVDLNFSLMVTFSWATTLLSLVLSSILDRSPSCWIATRGLLAIEARANEFVFSPMAFASK